MMDKKTRIEKMLQMTDVLQPEMVRLRRDFHRYPETGWLEMRTSAMIAQRLQELGYHVLTGKAVCLPEARMGVPDEKIIKAHAEAVLTQGVDERTLTNEMREGFTGVIGELRLGQGPTLAMRFDIDALGMNECPLNSHRPTRDGFASQNAGMMHACGHDAHGAIGLGVAQVLAALQDELCGTLRLIFQPGEEGARGAKAIVAAGHLDDVDVLVASHVAPADGPDDGDVTPGTWGSLATAKYDVRFTGLAAHAGGFPEKGRNALLAAASAALAIHAIPRHSGGRSFANVGTLQAGTGRNVVPDSAEMSVEVRGETTQINEFMAQRVEEICAGAAAMQGCQCEIIKQGEGESQHSDITLEDRVAKIVERDLPHLRLSSNRNAQNWGSEDVSFMMNRVQEHGGVATYMRVMTPMAGAQHTVTFDMDEEVLRRSAQVFCAIALDVMDNGK